MPREAASIPQLPLFVSESSAAQEVLVRKTSMTNASSVRFTMHPPCRVGAMICG